MKRLSLSSRILISVGLVALAGIICYAAFDVPIASFDGVSYLEITTAANGETVSETTAENAETTEQTQKVATSSSTANTKVTGVININTATVSELTALSGIGETKAQAIVDYRNENGKFSSIDEITNVSGIGEKTFEKIKSNICV